MKKLLFPIPTKLNDINYASGSFYSIYKNLRKYFEIIPVGPLKLKKNNLHSALNRLNSLGLFPYRFATMHSWKTIKGYGEQLQNYIDKENFDAIFSTSTLYAARVQSYKPVFAYTDLSYINALDYYNFASSLHPKSREEAIEVDRFCFEKYTKIFLASEWAKKHTIEAYNLPSNKIIVIGRGANLVSNYDHQKLNNIISERLSADIKNFLFVGKNWESKGGEVAYQIVKKMIENGFKVKLQIVGCSPPTKFKNTNIVEVFGLINTKNEKGKKTLKELYEKAWIFILPTKFEAMGISFNEASSFGLPSISFNTGGVSTAIENNKSGFLFELNDSIDYMYSRIISLFNDKELYKKMAHNAYDKFKNENNWDTIALKIKNAIEPII